MIKGKSEKQLEAELIKQLVSMGYNYVNIPDEAALIANFRQQLNLHNKKVFNGVPLSDGEFAQIMTEFNKPRSVFEASKFIRDRWVLNRDDNTRIHVEFANTREWCQNLFQVTHQTTMVNGYTIRYDVIILINGLPLVHIELKKTGIGIHEAYGQILRYKKQASSLFRYAQLFIISNGVNTRYFANNAVLPEFQNLFTWADSKNNKMNELHLFAEKFLEKCYLAKILFQYIVFHETNRELMVLRPYQIYAVEKLVGIVQLNALPKNGYVWHTTGSGKTLTAFKASQILINIPHVDKVLFVVDRNDLDYQTQKEFNAFSPGSVDGTDNTSELIKQIKSPTVPLIITTIQKLNNAVKHPDVEFRELAANQRTVLIFDECHRTQFGDTHQRINDFFKRKNMFGFTGTPIFAINSIYKKTTKDLFGECLHEYLIKDAINDGSVLAFSVEYAGAQALPPEEEDTGQYAEDAVTRSLGDLVDDNFCSSGIAGPEGLRDQIPRIHSGGFRPEPTYLKPLNDLPRLPSYKSPEWRSHVVDFIVEHHRHKTVWTGERYKFNAIFAVDSVDSAIKYYQDFKAAKDARRSNLKVATIYTYDTNGLPDYAAFLSEEEMGEETGESVPSSARDMLEIAMQDFNQMFGTDYSLKNNNGFAAYYMGVGKAIREGRIDILIVVNMFLTGFDSKTLNTLYVDKNLRYHSLLQAFSRTNRVLDRTKTHGNIVCFRPLKPYVDEAITLYADPDSSTIIIRRPYHELRQLLTEQVGELRSVTPTADHVDTLMGEAAKLEFAKTFASMLSTFNEISMYSKFKTDEPWGLDDQELLDYKSKYIDLKDEIAQRITAGEEDDGSGLLEFNFNIVSLSQDEINVDYIIRLLNDLRKEEGKESEFAKDIDNIRKTVATSNNLIPKKDLINTYIEEEIIPEHKTLPPEKDFATFMAEKRTETIQAEAENFGVSVPDFEKAINRYAYDGILDKNTLLEVSTYNSEGIVAKRNWKNRLQSAMKRIQETFH